MIVILEGSDLVGKTSLAKELSSKLGIPQTGIWIDLNNPKPAIISVSKTLKLLIQNAKLNLIFDRSFISEWVYSKLRNRDDEYLNQLINEWNQIEDLFLFILVARDEILRERFEVRGDEYLSINDIIKVNSLYYNLYNFIKMGIKCFLIDVSDLTTSKLSENIINILKDHNEKDIL